MKKFIMAAAAAILSVSLLVGCGAESKPQDSSSQEQNNATEQKATYTLYNTTGETVKELYIYEAGSEDKGENYAKDGMAADATTEVNFTAASEEEAQAKTYVVEFTTESGATQSFDTLHFEVAPISLLSVDAAAGATPIQFAAPEK